jgi:hypothetical protein
MENNVITRCYAIVDKNNNIIYIGITRRTIEERFKEHVREKKLDTSIYRVIELDNIDHGEDYADKDLKIDKMMEKFYISEAKHLGCKLINKTKGGEFRNISKFSKNGVRKGTCAYKLLEYIQQHDNHITANYSEIATKLGLVERTVRNTLPLLVKQGILSVTKTIYAIKSSNVNDQPNTSTQLSPKSSSLNDLPKTFILNADQMSALNTFFTVLISNTNGSIDKDKASIFWNDFLKSFN